MVRARDPLRVHSPEWEIPGLPGSPEQRPRRSRWYVRKCPESRGDAVHLADFLAARFPDAGIGIHVNFIRSLGENDAPDVPAFHHHIPQLQVVPLEGHQAFPHLRHGGHGGDVAVDLLAAEFFAGIHAVHGDGRGKPVHPALQLHTAQGFDHGGAVVRIDAELEHLPSHGAVHRPRVHHDEPQALGQDTRERAFSGCGRSVDGDGAMKDHRTGTVGRS